MHLRKISEATNKAALLNLEYLPTTLQQYYAEAMQTIRTQPVSHFKLARNTFALMSRAKDSLKVEELQEALCVATSDHKLDCSQLTPFPIILNVCLGFINSDRQSKVVDFFHVTFQEWLLASWDAWSELQPDIGQCCLTYLMLEDFSEPCKSEDLIVARRQQYPFAAYASRFWADHIRGKSESNLQEPLLHFLLSPNVISSVQLLPQNASRDVRLMGKPSEWLEITESNDHIALYLSICLRLEKTLAALLQKGFAPPLVVPWGECYSPLHAALRLRADEICKKLIMKGTWTDVRDRRGMTPLHLALEMSGSALTLQTGLLMSTAKARIDIPDCEGRTALHCAIRADKSSAVQYMLKNYTSIDASSWDIAGNTPFHEAIYQKNSRMIGLLISNNFSPMVQNRAGKSALAVAIENSDPTARSIVEQIIRAADHPNACFQLPAPELAAGVAFLESLKEQEANAKRSAAAVKASVEKQQAQRGPDRLGRLAKASKEGNIRDLVILILNGVKLNVVDPASGMTPLQHAVSTGQTEAAWHLLAAGADHNVNDPQGLSARDMAERDGRREILALFYGEAWMSVERPVGEVPYEREMSGRELREVYAHAEEVVQIKGEYEYSDTSWSYRGTDWFEYLGFHGGHRALTSRH
jgi:ankyrin repeat protein